MLFVITNGLSRLELYCDIFLCCYSLLCVGAVAMATENKDFVVGVVCRGHLSDSPGFIHMTPGGLCVLIRRL